MRTINNAISNSKVSVNEAKAARIQQEHAQVIDLVKHELGISDFKNESAKVRESVRALILEMWTPENGLTAKGARAINEGATNTLTEKSTEEQVRRFCNHKLLTSCRSFVNGTFSKADLSKELADVRSKVSEDTKKNFGRAIVDECFASCMCKAISSAFGVKMCNC